MKPLDESRASYQAWMTYAHEDLQVASLLIARGFSGPACFHAQQAAEKAIKAYLAWLGEEDIPRTHDLLSLSRLLQRWGREQPPQYSLMALNQHAVAARYPNEVPPTEDEAAQALSFAEELLDFVRRSVQS